MFSDFFLRELCRFWGNVRKYGGAGEATNDNMAARSVVH
jgi:hypothetical protein